jgi:hypothetical protein
MRGRWLLLAAGVGFFVVGLVAGAVVFASDDDAETSQPIQTTLPVSEASAHTGYVVQPVVAGVLEDGRPWTLRLDPDFGLCQIIGSVDFGCDVPNNDPPDRATPRRVVERNAFSTPQSGVLVYGFLPSGATQAELVFNDGHTTASVVVVESIAHFWAAPITPGDNSATIVYRNGDGMEVARYRAS